jgi:hypothetical protein
MVGQYSKNREDEQRLSGETVNFLPDELWDFYSGLPNPKWYEKTEEYE